VQEGWNCLINPSDDHIAQRIRDFNPPATQVDIFGRDVTDNMVLVIDRIASAS